MCEQLAVQFTVDSKVEPEALEALNTEAIPDSIEVDGVAVPTDVIQRSCEPSFRVGAEPEPPPTKVRCDPIRPGISVSNVKGTVGTVGCIVYDKHDGTPLVLSNWHVLHGPGGRIGESVVQPGPRDDNRIDRNRLGVLNRSHLGIAGDCAVATVDSMTAFSESTSPQHNWASPSSVTRSSRAAAPPASRTDGSTPS
ncbi:hypothetical protein [Nocardia bhagyanarayanae]|uniref:hypothetical protein n=1 Tax=Nocardia bhagyanarayanae TaxID=1215925 RepID=UPI0011523A95|nr:hypothetical protein [Nocardia bhagyanarayanae]